MNPMLNRSIQSTSPYAYDDVTWCVHTADLAPAWLNTFKTYSGGLWLVIGLTIVVCSILLFLFVKVEPKTAHQNYAWSCLTIFGTIISVFTVQYFPNKIFIRIFMASLTFAGINLWAAYTSSLISILTSPRFDKQITTVPEAVEAGMIFYGSVNYFDFILANKMNEPGYDELIKRFHVCESANQCFTEFANNKDSAIATSRIQAMHNAQALSIKKYCFDVENNLLEYSVSTLSYPYHHLLPALDDMIGMILQAGFIVKWARDVDEEKHYVYVSDHVKLTLDHVQGVFVMLGIGSLLAIIAFVIEWVHFVYTKGKHVAWQKLRQILKTFRC